MMEKFLHSNFMYLLLCLFLVLNFVESILKCSQYNFPKDRKRPSDCYRNIPVALLTSSAKVISVPDLLITILNCGTPGSEILFKNDGDAVQGTVPKGVVNITGGSVYNDMYYLRVMTFRNDVVPTKTRVSGTQDGIGSPIMAQLFCNNYAYPTGQQSLYPDAVLAFHFFINVVGNVPNRAFERFAQPVLKNVRKVNATYSISAKTAFSWLFDTLAPPYYSYPGSQRNSDTGEQTPDAIFIVPRIGSGLSISYPQFEEYFLKIKNSVGQLLTHVNPLFPQGNRPLIEIFNSVFVKYRK